jgi:hypothetical protein
VHRLDQQICPIHVSHLVQKWTAKFYVGTRKVILTKQSNPSLILSCFPNRDHNVSSLPSRNIVSDLIFCVKESLFSLSQTRGLLNCSIHTSGQILSPTTSAFDMDRSIYASFHIFSAAVNTYCIYTDNNYPICFIIIVTEPSRRGVRRPGSAWTILSKIRT